MYNGAAFLRHAVDSALAQTYRDVEVIVVNDGSDDGGATERIAVSYGDRIRYFAKGNGGVASALNLGIREMTGECFSWLSHDDVYLPRKIAAQVAALARETEPVILYGDYEEIDERGRRLGVVRTGFMKARDFRMALITDIPVNGCTALVPGECFDDVGVFDESLRVTQDYDLWFRMAGRYRFRHLPGVVLRSRVHPGQGTRAMPDVCAAEGNAQFIRQLDAFAEIRGGEPWLARFLLSAAVRLKRRGYLPASRHAFEMYLRRGGGGRLREFLAARYYGMSDGVLFRKSESVRRKVLSRLS